MKNIGEDTIEEPLKEYLVTWSTKISATSPEEAVIEAQKDQLDSECTLFEVTSPDGTKQTLDSFELMYGGEQKFALKCPVCGSDDIEYSNHGWTTDKVYVNNAGYVENGENVSGESYESYYECNNCGHRDDDENSFLIKVNPEESCNQN